MRYTKLLSSLFVLAVFQSATFARADDALKTLPPQFAAIGQSFWMSTGCSPHSASLRLEVLSDSMLATQIQPYTSTETISLNYTSLDLTVLSNEGGPHPTVPVPVVLHARVEAEKAAYEAALANLYRMVSTLRNGNVCFKGQSILDELVVYLNGLREQSSSSR